MNTKAKISQYKFEDSIILLRGITYSHLLFSILFIFPIDVFLLISPHAIICLSIFFFFFICSFLYNYQSQHSNLILLALYITLLIIEFFIYGIPNSAIDYSQGYKLSKGVMFDILIIGIPYVYLGLRILFLIPIINLILRRQKMESQA